MSTCHIVILQAFHMAWTLVFTIKCHCWDGLIIQPSGNNTQLLLWVMSPSTLDVCTLCSLWATVLYQDDLFRLKATKSPWLKCVSYSIDNFPLPPIKASPWMKWIECRVRVWVMWVEVCSLKATNPFCGWMYVGYSSNQIMLHICIAGATQCA